MLRAGGLFLQAGELGAFVGNLGYPPVGIEVVPRVVDQVEAQAWLQAHVVALHFGDAGVMAQGGEPVLGKRLTDHIAFVAAGVVEPFVLGGLMIHIVGDDGMLLAVRRVGEGVVALHLAGGAHLFAVAETAQIGLGWVATAVGLVQHGVGISCLLAVKEAFVLVLALDVATADQPQ
ncbi:hypothetical protein D9M71_249660 [compost metagenome]